MSGTVKNHNKGVALTLWERQVCDIETEAELAAVCIRLIGGIKGLSDREIEWLDSNANRFPPTDVASLRRQILDGHDPLGDAFHRLRSPADRRELGQTNTPPALVGSMLRWISHQPVASRIVDVGAGSGRFTLQAARRFPQARIVAVELDPLPALMLRANVHTLALTNRVQIIVDDFRRVTLPNIKDKTAFIGNPPYVRHHDIGEKWKAWYQSKFSELNIPASGLAGLHLHFFLKIALLAQPDDYGALITSAEWLDVNYGSALRKLLMSKLGAIGLHVLEPTVEAFPGTATTAAITCFRARDDVSPVRVRSVSKLHKLNSLSGGVDVPKAKFSASARWSIIVHGDQTSNQGSVPLGEFFDVHRGQVTGANWVWIANEHATALPQQVLVPTVTKAKDLISSGAILSAAERLRRVVDLPVDLDRFTKAERFEIDRFLDWARMQGADSTYVAQHRKAWWSVGLKPPAPILCTYMARRAPQFTINVCGARHINVAHGLYPKQPLDPETMRHLVKWLNESISVASGRTYAGGLTKFEPKEVERLLIPRLEDLR